MASRGVGGTNGRPGARDRMADGKMPGNGFVRRAIQRRFLSAFSASHLDMVGPYSTRQHDAIEVLKLSSLAAPYGTGVAKRMLRWPEWPLAVAKKAWKSCTSFVQSQR
jgi:hypothetical protein